MSTGRRQQRPAGLSRQALAATSGVAVGGKPFYGWRVLGVTMTLSFFATLMSQLFTGAMLPHIEEGTGWSRSSITIAVTLGTVIGGLMSPFFGRFADRHGPRVLASAGVLVTAIAMIGVGVSGYFHIALFYVAYIIGRSVTQNTFAGVTAQTTAVNWFRRMRGRALGLTAMAIPLGGAVLIPVAQLMIESGLAWETVYFVFAAVLLFAVLPAAALVLRRRPEDMGLLADGDSQPPPVEGSRLAVAPAAPGWTLKQAMRTPTLWLMIGAMGAAAAANSAISFHQLAFYKDQGISVTLAALALSLYALSGAVASGLWGFVIERIAERVIGAATMLAAALLCLFLLTVETPAAALVFSVLFGLAARGEGAIMHTMLAQYYGRDSYGAIAGFTSPFQMLALGAGPLVAALLYDASGQSYTLAILVSAAIFLTGSLLVWLSRRPESG